MADEQALMGPQALARMAYLRRVIQEHEEWEAEQRREEAEMQEQLAAAASALQPGSVGLVQEAVNNPEVTPQNFGTWVRSKLPTMQQVAMNALVTALSILFVTLVKRAAQDAPEERDPSSWQAPPGENVLWHELTMGPRALYNALPSVRHLRAGEGGDPNQAYPSLLGSFQNSQLPQENAHPERKSVVDAVFAKAGGKTGGR
jgi:hypothetical protein